MRKLILVALMTGLCFMGFSTTASATSVNLVFTGGYASSGVVGGLGGSDVTLEVGATATLTMDVQLDVDSDGLSAGVISLRYDTDLNDELDTVRFQELAWSNAKGNRTLTQLNVGIEGSQESSSSQEGYLLSFEGTSLGTGPKSTTLTFARVVFTTNGVRSDGDDIFSGVFNPGIDVIGNNAGDVVSGLTGFGGASVNVVPEPGTVSLLGLGIGALALAGRRRNRK
jgi:hypothetical protein